MKVTNRSLPRKSAGERARNGGSVVFRSAKGRSFAERKTILFRVSLGIAFALCLACHSAVSAQDADETPITVKELQAHAAFLASDTLQGREAGTAGGQAAAAYLANELRLLKCKPIGSGNDYRQPFGAGYQNVLGLLEGSDPQLKDEWIVLGAHFDHVGFGNVENSQGPFGQIHNGADDNASGVACLLEIAEALKGAPPLGRSVAVAFWDGEEKGLLGSEHWLKQHPKRQQIRFYINLDMVGRLRDDTVEMVGVRTMLGLRSQLARANASELKLTFDWSQRNDSDHYSFYLRSIPYAMFYTGMHNDYHRPSDDIEKLNIPGMQRVATVVTRYTTQLANYSEPLVFRKACQYELTPLTPKIPLPSRLGVTWSPARVRGETIKLSKVNPDLVADRAGLKPGDELRTINGQDVREVDDFIAWVRQSPVHWEIDLVRAATGEPDHVALDLDGFALPPGASAASSAAEPGIVYLTLVKEASFAAQSGFLPGDRIQRVQEGSAPSARHWEVERDGRLLVLPQ